MGVCAAACWYIVQYVSRNHLEGRVLLSCPLRGVDLCLRNDAEGPRSVAHTWQPLSIFHSVCVSQRVTPIGQPKRACCQSHMQCSTVVYDSQRDLDEGGPHSCTLRGVEPYTRDANGLMCPDMQTRPLLTSPIPKRTLVGQQKPSYAVMSDPGTLSLCTRSRVHPGYARTSRMRIDNDSNDRVGHRMVNSARDARIAVMRRSRRCERLSSCCIIALSLARSWARGGAGNEATSASMQTIVGGLTRRLVGHPWVTLATTVALVPGSVHSAEIRETERASTQTQGLRSFSYILVMAYLNGRVLSLPQCLALRLLL